MQNLYLFSGENQYELRTEIKKRKDSFAEKFGAECVFSYTSENRDTGIIKQNLYGGGFFSSKKLIFLFGLPIDTETTNKLKADQREKLSEELISANHILEDTIVICISYKPDKRGKFYKRISKEGQVKEFGLHDKRGISTWIKKEFADLNLDSDALSALITKVGTNQFRLGNEMEKLRYRKEAHPSTQLSASLVEEIVFGMTEADSFKFFDHLFASPEKACQIIDDIQNEGTDRNQTSGMLYRGLKNYLIVLDYHRQGISDAKQIASEVKLNPFSLYSPLKHIETLKEKESAIKNFFTKLVELDYDIKMGHLPAEYFWLRVKELVLQSR